MTVDEQIAEAKSLWNEVGYRLDTTTPNGRLAMLAPILASALETALAEVEKLKAIERARWEKVPEAMRPKEKRPC